MITAAMPHIDNGLILILRSSCLADAEPDLGARLMSSFLESLLAADRLPARVILLGSGVLLSTEGSPVLGLLERLVASGSDVASCLTCLDYYGRRDKLRVGREGNMKQTVEAMLAADKILGL